MIITASIILLALAVLVIRDACRCVLKGLEIWLARGSDQTEGHGFDANIAPRISAVRRDYMAEIHSREDNHEYRDHLLATARHAVRRLSFFAKNSEGNHDQSLFR